MKILLCFALVACATTPATHAPQQQEPPLATPGAQHKWLGQLVGEWTAHTESSMGPDTESTTFDSTESVRSVGGLWVLAEGNADMNGTPFTSFMTLGYDPAKSAFVGTWVCSMQTEMWIYRGTLDDAKKVLTLEVEGPAFDDPSKRALYHDTITIVDATHRKLDASVRGADGKWTTFMTATYTRK